MYNEWPPINYCVPRCLRNSKKTAKNQRNKQKRLAQLHTHKTVFGLDYYSHSIVAGGFDEISYTTRLIPFTLLIISFDTFAKNS